MEVGLYNVTRASDPLHLTFCRRHAFSDLRPYICIVDDCDADYMDFSSRAEFAAHLTEHQHINLWICAQCGHTEEKKYLIRDHINFKHATGDNTHRNVDFIQKSVPRDLSSQSCPFCGEVPGTAEFVGHLCHHLEEISLSAIPRDAGDDEDDEGESSSGTSLSKGRIEEMVGGFDEHFDEMDMAGQTTPDGFPRDEDNPSIPFPLETASQKLEQELQDINMPTELSSDRSSTHDEEGGNAPTPPPPPQHGYPGTADAYRENVPVPNALEWNGGAIVWDNHDHPDSSQVLFDPRCKPNFISWKLALRIGFQPLLLPEAQWRLFSTLRGQQGLARHHIKLDIEMRRVRFPRESVYLLVVETDEIEILLGEYFLAEFGITERLVANAQARTASNAHAIITLKPTPGMIPSKPRLVLGIRLTHIVFPEQIRNVLLDKER
jgi:hypothetical protein